MMITLTRSNAEYFDIDGVFGKLVLQSGDENINLYTKEKIWSIMDKWPYGKPIDSCVPNGEYQIVRQYSPLNKSEELFLYNPDIGVYVYSADRKSATQRYGSIITYQDIHNIAEGCIQVGMNIAQKNGKRALTDTTKAYNILRSWVDKKNEQAIKITWGRDRII